MYYEDKKKLKELYFDMMKMKLGTSCKNQELDDIIESICELDPYYAGLALTVSEGGKIHKKDLFDIESLKNKLNLIVIGDENDEAVLSQCCDFIRVINEIDSILRKFV